MAPRKRKPKMGRPSKFSASSAEVVAAAYDGLNRRQAAVVAGISSATLMRWMARGRSEQRGPYRAFVKRLERAEFQCKANRYYEYLVNRFG